MSDTEPNRQRRRFLKAVGGGAGLAGLAGCAGGGGDTPTPRVERETVVRERTVVQERTVVRTPTQEELTEMHTINPEGDVSVAPFLFGINNGTWRQHGIDLSMEVAAFGKFSRQISADLAEIGGVSIPPIVSQVNQGEDITLLGTKLNFFNQMLALPGHGIEDLSTYLADKSLGVPFAGSTTTNVYRGIFQDRFDFDILEDTAETRASAPPVLWNLLHDGELDVIIEFSGFTIRANATDDVVTVYDPYQDWLDQYGIPPPVANWAARTSWLEENAALALSWLQGWEDALNLTLDNIDTAIRNYGRLAGLTSDAEATVVKEWMQDDKVFGPLEYTQEIADNNWELVRLMGEAGAFEELPDKDTFLTTRAELEEMAGM